MRKKFQDLDFEEVDFLLLFMLYSQYSYLKNVKMHHRAALKYFSDRDKWRARD
jgi:hypothetical protein